MTKPQKTMPKPKLVVLGSSAGGITALKEFFAALGDKVGDTSFLVVQHLAKSYESQLSKILDIGTGLQTQEVSQPVKIQSGIIYTLPSSYAPKIEGDILSVMEVKQHEKIIDLAFQAAASAFETIGIVLSGASNDGAVGLRAIKQVSGHVFVQDPNEAEFDFMPRAAIATEEVDFVGTAAALALRVISQQRIPTVDTGKNAEESSINPDGLMRIIATLNKKTGIDFYEYRTGMLGRRIARRMALFNLKDVDAYEELLNTSPDEANLLKNDLLIGVTGFFRDPESWEALKSRVVDPLVEATVDHGVIRAWSAGCATGEETYTLAMLLHDAIERSGKTIGLQVFGTDLSAAAITTARMGRYPVTGAEEIPKPLLDTYFNATASEIQVVPFLREKVIFAEQNSISDPPFSRMDLITCRNLLIYLQEPLQKVLLTAFHFALVEGGALFLGSSESTDRAPDLFEPVDARHRILRARKIERRLPMFRHSATTVSDAPAQTIMRTSIQSQTDVATRAMLQRFAPPALLINEAGNMLAMHGKVMPYLEGDSSVLSGHVQDILRTDIANAVMAHIDHHKSYTELVVAPIGIESNLPVNRIAIEALKSSPEHRQYLVYFLSGTSAHQTAALAVEKLEGDQGREVEALKQTLQDLILHSEANQQQLQIANEEVMSSNEELQSMNEELETSREELQSVNEELSTINEQLELKVQELSSANTDLKNLIAVTDIATMFVDTDLSIRRFSDSMSEFLSIRSEDIGRPFSDLHMRVDDAQLKEHVTLALAGEQVPEAHITLNDRTYIRRISSYRGADQRVTGAVITYTDITELQNVLTQQQIQLKQQLALADLGEYALGTDDIASVMQLAVTTAAECLGADMAGIIQLKDDEMRLTYGRGYPSGFVGTATVPNEPENCLGYTLAHQKPLRSSDLGAETRFNTSEMLKTVGAKALLTSRIGPVDQPRGVLQIAWRAPHHVTAQDESFLVSIAAILSTSLSKHEFRRIQVQALGQQRALVNGLPIFIGVIGEDLSFELMNRQFEELGWDVEEAMTTSIGDVFGESAREKITAFRTDHSQDTLQFEADVALPFQDVQTLLVHVSRDKRQKHRLYLGAIDITQRKEDEKQLRTISAELDHRVKNVLSLVSAIAYFTVESTSNLEEFQQDFAQRLSALGRTHEALSQNAWAGAKIEDLIRGEVQAFAGKSCERIDISGPDLFMNASVAQGMTLVFHEMVTNAVKYGALSREKAKLSVKWSSTQAVMKLIWKETGLSIPEAPTRKGFGLTVIDNTIKGQLKGQIERDFAKSGVIVKITLPIEHFR